ncbi:hypothetical protein HN865_01250 [Candidatus Woesearchaeota archaeon]|nr:hypothetical protein [Candidatus Woesearchaeota archaeon]
MDHKVLIKRAESTIRELSDSLDFHFPFWVNDSVNAEWGTDFGSNLGVTPNLGGGSSYLFRLEYGQFSDETQEERVKKFEPALDYLIKHEFGHLVLGFRYRIKPEESTEKEGNKHSLIVPLFNLGTGFDDPEQQHDYVDIATEAAVDKIAMGLDSKNVIDSLVYTTRRKFSETQSNGRTDPKFFFYLAEHAAILEETGQNRISKEIRKYVESNFEDSLKSKFNAVVDTYRDVYRNTTFEKR